MNDPATETGDAVAILSSSYVVWRWVESGRHTYAVHSRPRRAVFPNRVAAEQIARHWRRVKPKGSYKAKIITIRYRVKAKP